MAAQQDPLRTIAAISLFTEDLEASKEFYTKVFGAAVLGGDEEACAVQFNNVILNLLKSSAAGDLVGEGNVAKPTAGKRTQMSIWVKDLDAEMARLKERGVVFLSGPEVKPWGLRIVTFDDPAGHNWEVAQQVGKEAGAA